MQHHKGILFNHLRSLFAKNTKEKSSVRKVYGKDTEESSFVEKVNGQLEKDLKRFGTPMGIIDVVQDEKDLSNSNNASWKKLNPREKRRIQKQKNLEQFGTRQGIIEVAEEDYGRKYREKQNKCFPSNRRFRGDSEADKERFGTLQGIINVSSDESLIEDQLCAKDLTASVNLYAELYKDFSKAQVTIRNNTPNDKEITLWGAKPQVITETVSYESVQDQLISSQISSAVHPQGLVYNPITHNTYVANQLSGTVSVINTQNEPIRNIQLDPVFPGLCSPVAIAVNTNPASLHFGFLYVACSVSNTLQVISTEHIVVSTISVGCRPIAVAYNQVNNLVYVANLASDNLTVINAESNTIIPASPLPTGDGPIAITTHPISGNVFVCNSASNSITVLDSSNVLISTISNAGNRPVCATYNPANGFIYVSSTDSNELLKISTADFSITTAIPVGQKPYNSFFMPLNQFLYVQNREDNTLTVLRANDTQVATLSLGEQNIGGAFNPENATIYTSDTNANSINAISFSTASTSVTVSSDYAEIQSDFKSNFAIIQHARFIVSGEQRLYGFKLNRANATGSASTRKFSFEPYASPAHGSNVSEFLPLAGTLLDNKVNWKFMLPGFHTVSVLIWYRQFQVQDLLKNNYSKQTKTKI